MSVLTVLEKHGNIYILKLILQNRYIYNIASFENLCGKYLLISVYSYKPSFFKLYKLKYKLDVDGEVILYMLPSTDDKYYYLVNTVQLTINYQKYFKYFKEAVLIE